MQKPQPQHQRHQRQRHAPQLRNPRRAAHQTTKRLEQNNREPNLDKLELIPNHPAAASNHRIGAQHPAACIRHGQIQNHRHQAPKSEQQRQPNLHQRRHSIAKHPARTKSLHYTGSRQSRQRNDASPPRQGCEDLSQHCGAHHQKRL